MIQIKTLKIQHGRVIAEETSDTLNVDYLETVKTVQQNARGTIRNLKGILDTPDGVIKTNRDGYIEIYSVRVILD